MAVEGRDWSAARLAVVIALISGITAVLATIGADARWLAALGRIVVDRGSVPAGIPFASASTSGWANTLVLAEVIFYGLEHALGDRGLIIAQTVAVACAMAALAWDARAEGAGSIGTSSALALAFVGSLESLVVARVQLFSLVLFPLLVMLLRSEARSPSKRVYLALPLLALWSNLHGAALLGLGIVWVYLALDRFRRDRWTAAVLVVLAPVALCLTPAGVDTVDYYRGLLGNVAAQRGVGLWAPLGTGPLDLITIACALMLFYRIRRHVPALWEIVVIVALAVLTVKAARDSVWLLFFLVAPAAHSTRMTRDWNGLLPFGAVCALAFLALGLTQSPHRAAISPRILGRALALADGRPILADAIPAEQVALAGGRIWVGNPLDAFSHRVQGLYLDWLAGTPNGRLALSNPAIDVVLVKPDSGDDTLTASDSAFVLAAQDRTARVYVRRSTFRPSRDGGAGSAN